MAGEGEGAAAAAVVGEGQTWQEQFLGGEEFAELRENPTLSTIQDIPNLAKALVETKGLVGRKGVILPGENATPEEMAAFHTALGRPETAEAYEIAAPADLPEGFPYAPELEAGFKQWAFEEGLSATQAKNLFSKYLTANVENFKAAGEAQAAAFKRDQETITAALKKDWGADYDANFAMAQTAMQEFFPPGSKALAALDKVMGDDADLIRMAYTIGKRMGEAGFVKGGPGGAAAAGLEARRLELTASKAYTDAKDPDHAKVVKEVTEIYQKLHPEAPQ
jgi:hypothetical protein